MLSELSLLIELQKIDQEILAAQRKIEATPAKIREVEQPFLDAKASYEARKKQLDEFLQKRRAKEQQLEDVAAKVEKLKARVSEIKTNKEYQAHLKEIASFEQDRAAVEDELLVFMVQADDMVKMVKEAELVVKAEQGRMDEFAESLRRETQVLEAALAEVKSRRSQLVSGIPEALYNDYMRHLEIGQGLAVAQARDSVCLGCHMNIPPQLYVEVRRGDQIITCPQCRRYLCYIESEGETHPKGS